MSIAIRPGTFLNAARINSFLLNSVVKFPFLRNFAGDMETAVDKIDDWWSVLKKRIQKKPNAL
jgi:hypothetical protein